MKYLLYLLALLLPGVGICATECHLAEGGKGGSMAINGGTTNNPLNFYSVYGDTSSTVHELDYFDPTLSHELWSYCDSGPNGDDFYMYTNNGADVVETDGRALFPTNIDGIYYAVKLFSTAGAGGYFPGTTGSWINVYPSETSDWKSQQVKATITLYQMSAFPGNVNNVTYLTPKDSRTLGQIRVGTADSDDNNPWSITVDRNSFSVPISAATCSSVSGNDGTNNVDFGDVMYSSLREYYWQSKTLTLKLAGCTNTVWFRFKLASSKYVVGENNTMLLTNTLTGSDAASGVGVSLSADFPIQGVQNVFSPGLEIWTPTTTVSYSRTYNYDFTTVMKLSGETLKPGKFKAIGTFTIDYF